MLSINGNRCSSHESNDVDFSLAEVVEIGRLQSGGSFICGSSKEKNSQCGKDGGL